MGITFSAPCLLVRDIQASRTFYEQVLGQRVVFDHGVHIVFGEREGVLDGGFAIWQAEYARGLILGEKAAAAGREAQGRDNFELYFESEDVERAWAEVSKSAEVLNPLFEQPWKQRAFRVRDPDGHIVEVAETIPTVLRRMLDQGLSPEEVSEQTLMPLEYVRAVAKN